MEFNKLLIIGFCSFFVVASSLSLYALVGNAGIRNKFEITNNAQDSLRLVIELPIKRNIELIVAPKTTKIVKINHEVRGLCLYNRLYNRKENRMVSQPLHKIHFAHNSPERNKNRQIIITKQKWLEVHPLSRTGKSSKKMATASQTKTERNKLRAV